MSQFDCRKYKAADPFPVSNRQWPDQVITQAPVWCSVDLRDGNQALIEPMTVSQKEQLFRLLVKVGFKQIEVGFPAASQSDFEFVRHLIEASLIPDDVTIQVLTQARSALIKRTFEALSGAKKVIVHFYNSTSTVQRRDVFDLARDGITEIATKGAELIKAMAEDCPETQWTFEYSPESFTGTENDFAVDICNAVLDVFQPTIEQPVIINLPATVETTTPNVFADRVEWFARHVHYRDAVILSVHTHNDRGCAVAAAELAVMAGADRVEGTLLGNGERTGNMDTVTMAMNLYSQGIDPRLDLSNMHDIVNCVQQCTQMPIHPRHPYVGDLVYTAFSGSHQDAINKCLMKRHKDDVWDVAYLPIDPEDLGRSYQEVIRINSQSGKGGVAYVLAQEYGLYLPRWAQIEFSGVVQCWTERHGGEISSQQIWALFKGEYIDAVTPYQLSSYNVTHQSEDVLHVVLSAGDDMVELEGRGRGVIQALVQSLHGYLGDELEILSYHEHALSVGAEAKAVTYIHVKYRGQCYCGVAISEDIVSSSINAVLSALNQAAGLTDVKGREAVTEVGIT